MTTTGGATGPTDATGATCPDAATGAANATIAQIQDELIDQEIYRRDLAEVPSADGLHLRSA